MKNNNQVSVHESIHSSKNFLTMLSFHNSIFQISGGVRMTLKIVKTLLSIVLVFMYYLGFWTANSATKIVFFFLMIVFIFEVGVETGKKHRNNI